MKFQKLTINIIVLKNLRVALKEDLSVKWRLFLVDCSDLKVSIRRNLQPTVFKKIEPLSIEVIYGGLLVSQNFRKQILLF
jgi:hypothetical protein